MSDYEKKEAQILEKIGTILNSLDGELNKIDTLDADGKSHHIKKWYAEKRAIHDIKKIVHEAGKYQNYDDKELEKIDKMFNSMMNDN